MSGSGTQELRSGQLLGLEHVVVFIDEVDDIASSRAARPETQAAVNELLKAMVRVRESPGCLLVCATNSIAALDPAVVRPGRFDLVVPIGPPDAEARLALLRSMLGAIPASDAEPTAIVDHTDGLTPADMASAIQQAAAGPSAVLAPGTLRHCSPPITCSQPSTHRYRPSRPRAGRRSTPKSSDSAASDRLEGSRSVVEMLGEVLAHPRTPSRR